MGDTRPVLVDLPDELVGPRVIVRPFRDSDAEPLWRAVANTRSRAIPERLGYVYEGCERNALPDVNGKPRDVNMFSLIPDEYHALSWASSHVRQ